jgi:phospholipid transport system transporter-binding protein
MTEASIRTSDNAGQLLLAGVLDPQSAPALRQQGQVLIRNASSQEIVIDCSNVERSTSVGVALLLAYLRDADAAGKSLRFFNLPQDMRQIAQVSGVTEFLPLVR